LKQYFRGLKDEAGDPRGCPEADPGSVRILGEVRRRPDIPPQRDSGKEFSMV